GRPWGQVTVRAMVKETLASPGRQDATTGIGHGNEAVEIGHLPSRAGGQATELGEHYIALDRVGAVLGRGRRCPVQAGVDPVLFPAPVPRREDLRPDALDGVFPGGEALPGLSGPREAVVGEAVPVRCV